MSRKKIIYITVIAILLILGYLNYFSDEKNPEDTNPKIVTTNVAYKSDDYFVEAKKQIDYMKENETSFEYGKVHVNSQNIDFSGDDIYIDKVRNVEMKKNIKGKNNAGWEIESEAIKYTKISDEISSDDGLKAINTEKNVSIYGKHVRTNSKMTYIDLKEDVTLVDGNMTVLGDRGNYNSGTRKTIIEGNVKLDGHDKDNFPIAGNFVKAEYDMDTRIGVTNERFDTTYRGVKLEADKMWYDQNTGSFEIKENVSFESAGYKIYVDRMEKLPGEDTVKIYGKIHGGNNEYQLEADEGNYDTIIKKLYIHGNIKVTSVKNEILTADNAILDMNTQELIVSGDNRDVVYSSQDGTLNTKEVVYKTDTKEMFVNDKYKFVGAQYDSMGDKAYYNSIKKVGYVINGYLLNKDKKSKISGNRIDGNQVSGIYTVKGIAAFENDKYKVDGDYAEYNENTGKGIIEGDYTVTILKDGTQYKGSNGRYDDNTGDFTDDGEIKVIGKDFEIEGEDLKYNSKTGEGGVKSKVVFKNTTNGTTITGDKFSFQKDNFVKLEVNVTLENDKLVAKTTSGVYNLKEEIVSLPDEIIVTAKDGTFNGKISKGDYYTEKNIFIGKKFSGIYTDYDMKSDELEYDTQAGKIALVKNASIINKINPKELLKGNRLEYTPKEKILGASGGYTANYDNYTITGNNVVYNMTSGMINGNKINIVSDTDSFSSDKVKGQMLRRFVDFIGHAEGSSVRDDIRTDFKGDSVRLYLKSSGKGYRPVRSEIKQNIVLTQPGKIATSDYMELDVERKRVFARENVKIISDDEKNGHTEATGDSMEADNVADTATINGNGLVKNRNVKNEEMTAIGQIIKIDRKSGTVEVSDRARIENADGYITGDHIFYDLNTKKAKAKGNVYVEYKTKKKNKE